MKQWITMVAIVKYGLIVAGVALVGAVAVSVFGSKVAHLGCCQSFHPPGMTAEVPGCAFCADPGCSISTGIRMPDDWKSDPCWRPFGGGCAYPVRFPGSPGGALLPGLTSADSGPIVVGKVVKTRTNADGSIGIDSSADSNLQDNFDIENPADLTALVNGN